MVRGAIDGCWGRTVGGIGGHNNYNIIMVLMVVRDAKVEI